MHLDLSYREGGRLGDFRLNGNGFLGVDYIYLDTLSVPIKVGPPGGVQVVGSPSPGARFHVPIHVSYILK